MILDFTGDNDSSHWTLLYNANYLGTSSPAVVWIVFCFWKIRIRSACCDWSNPGLWRFAILIPDVKSWSRGNNSFSCNQGRTLHFALCTLYFSSQILRIFCSLRRQS